MLVLAIWLINLGYGFDGTGERLGRFQFISRTLTGVVSESRDRVIPGNRFSDGCLSVLPVLLPRDYLLGMDEQKWDFERGMWSYLQGEWRLGGWWYYYLYGLAVKVPLGTSALLVLAVVMRLRGGHNAASWRDELVLLVPWITVLTLVSAQTNLNRNLRYILPVLPFAFIWISQVARTLTLRRRVIASLTSVALAWSIASSLWCYPHSLSYFNELVGGPKGGPAHLLDCNIDWGQDLLNLKRWLEKHPEVSGLRVAYYGSCDLHVVGIHAPRPAVDPRPIMRNGDSPKDGFGPQPGWHAISANYLYSRSGEFDYFREFEPVAMAGYSIYVYHITLDGANRVRKEVGRAGVPKPQQPSGRNKQ